MPEDLSTTARAILESRIATLRTEQAIPGVVARVLRHGEVVTDVMCGEATIGGPLARPDSVFRIASMTKSFTAAAILLLRDRRLLRLDDRVADVLPVAQIDGPAITVRDLLAMNAGLPTDDPWGDRQESLACEDFDRMVDAGLSFARAPRMGFEYSNAGYAILGRVITRVSGVDYLDFVRRELLEPLAMTHSQFDVTAIPTEDLATGYAETASGLVAVPPVRPGAFSAMGGLHSTVVDLTAWVRGFMGSQPHPLGEWTRREMQQPQNWARTSVNDLGSVTSSYAYGLMVDDNSALGRFVHHSGGYPGYGSHMRWHAQSGWAVILLANRTYANMRRVGEETMNDLVAQFPGATDPQLWPRTLDAMDVCESLLLRWDDALADEWFSMNVDLDQAREERRDVWRRAGEGMTSLTRESVTSQSPAYASWTVSDGATKVRLELLLSPEATPRLQALSARRL